ncbi:hypothetical protein ACFVWN_01170 [Nocardiopsis flavescens]|uniref:hypothetical protein n=1 Tax=Nocardiopsis flavescens TaxID=758803 RepID=UPI00364FC464
MTAPYDEHTLIVTFTTPPDSPVSLGTAREVLAAIAPHLPVTATVAHASLTRNDPDADTGPAVLVEPGRLVEVDDGITAAVRRVVEVGERDDAPDRIVLEADHDLYGLWLPLDGNPDRGGWASHRGRVLLDTPEQLKALRLPGLVRPWPGPVDACRYLETQGLASTEEHSEEEGEGDDG